MPNLVKSVRYMKCYSSSSPRPIESTIDTYTLLVILTPTQCDHISDLWEQLKLAPELTMSGLVFLAVTWRL